VSANQIYPEIVFNSSGIDMNDLSADSQRRQLLKSAAAGLAISVTGVSAASDGQAKKEAPYGKPDEFNFLAGEWKIQHRRLKPDTKEWDEFEGEATCWTILDGIGSVEELRIPARNFSGMGLRLLDAEKKIWSDFWVNAKSGMLTTPGMTGVFIDGAGVFTADNMDADKPIKVRGVWDNITPRSCRWYQALSYDNGKTWKENWFMQWTRT
jgi:hypothetical protein